MRGDGAAPPPPRAVRTGRPTPIMIVLHTLGVAAIHLGARRVVPSATRAFASLLFLGIERGRDVPRGELQELLFPGQGERKAAHNMRQLLYRLRALGAPVVAGERTVLLPAAEVRADFSALRAGPLAPEVVAAVAAGILPGYAPSFSRRFAEWVEAQRGRIGHELLAVLARRLAELREAGRWRELEPVARSVLGLDPLHEEATLGLAECLALGGQKVGAVQLLDAYIGEVGAYGPELRLSAQVLRTRISERVPGPTHRRLGPGPFVGRDAEMAELWRHYRSAKRGEPRTVVIYGEPGIGKTRLATEFMKAAGLDGALCLKVECAPHDVRRPLGVFVDLVPKLLEAPGGLGVSPEGMEHLQYLVKAHDGQTEDPALGEPDFLQGRTWKAIDDLLLAVSSEAATVIVVDDAHWADSTSVTLIQGLAAKRATAPILVLLTSRDATSPKFPHPLDATISRHRIRPLSTRMCHTIFRDLKVERNTEIDPIAANKVVELAKGNPLFLRSLALAIDAPDSEAVLPTDIRDLIRRELETIEEPTLHVFLAAAALGPLSTPQRIAAILELPFVELIHALQVLEDRGFLEPGPDATAVVHPLVSEALQGRSPRTVVNSLHYRAALHLELDGRKSRDISLLWSAVEHWAQCGEPSRAIELVRDLAHNALRIGQPQSACELLQKVERLCPVHHRADFYRSLALAAHAAENAELTRDSVRGHRSALGTSDVHDALEFLDVEAARLTDEPIAVHVSRLYQCLRSARASSDHRVHAAHMLMIAFEMTLEVERARELYDEVLHSPLPVSTTKERARLFRLTYHTFAGDPKIALGEARDILNLPAEEAPPNVRRRLLSHAGASLFRCGACAEACTAHRESFAIAKRFGMTSSALYDAATLAWMYWILGYSDEWKSWDGIADELYASTRRPSRSSLYLSNKIEFAIARGATAEARKWLDQARSDYPEIVTARSRAIERAFAVRIELLDRRALSREAVQELHALHVRGKSAGLHDPVAECYWFALTTAGRSDEAEAMIQRYAQLERRDRFPFRMPRSGAPSPPEGA